MALGEPPGAGRNLTHALLDALGKASYPGPVTG